jgi:hypothetical protein
MAKDFVQDPDAWRAQGNQDRAAGDVNYKRAVGDPEWEDVRVLEYQHGKWAHAFNTYALEHARLRPGGFNGAGDRRYGLGDGSTYTGSHFEGTDQAGGTGVRNSMPDE